jgi:hypothetical protein
LKLLYISYWGINDVLSKATVFPSLKIVRPYFSEINLATIERSKSFSYEIPEGIVHAPFNSLTKVPRFLEKTFDLIFYSLKLLLIAKRKKIDVVICRGSMAAAFGVFLRRITGLPFLVESFEPHADYMLEGGTWKKSGIEYRFQKWVEAQTIKHASYIMPVTYNYAEHLMKNGVSGDRVLVMPCCVNIDKFIFSEQARTQVRNKLGVGADVIVGIYVGKFGDIYLKEEAFKIFKQAFDFFEGNFYLIILSPQSEDEITKHLRDANIRLDSVYMNCVEHDKVPEFLSAADFAFSLIRPSASRKFCSPIKNGEYWANGLPIVLTKGVGDDEKIVLQTRLGVILDIVNDNTQSSFTALKELIGLGRTSLAKKIYPIANQYRNFEIITRGYSHVFTNGLQKK